MGAQARGAGSLSVVVLLYYNVITNADGTTSETRGQYYVLQMLHSAIILH